MKYSSNELYSKGSVVESTLQHCLNTFREILSDLKRVQSDYEDSKAELVEQKEKCESKNCSGAELLKKIIESKDTIIHLATSAVINYIETKNQNDLDEIMRILCGEVTTLTPPSPSKHSFEKIRLEYRKDQLLTPKRDKNKPSPIKDENRTLDNMSVNDSTSEIEGTPGRTSPILQSKKLKSSSSSGSLPALTELREKKKCPPNWSSPNSKQMKLGFVKMGSSGQCKLNFSGNNDKAVVGLTCSPVFLGGNRNTQTVPNVQILIKKESSENDDTILPSPTSSCGPPSFTHSKTSSKENQRFKKPFSLSRVKKEPNPEVPDSPIVQVVEPKVKDFMKADVFDESVNILKHNRFLNSPNKASPRKSSNGKLVINKERSPVKKNLQSPNKMRSPRKSPPKVKVEPSDDDTRCDDSALLQEKPHAFMGTLTKTPLKENVNLINLPAAAMQSDTEYSMSLLCPEPITAKVEDNVIKRKLQSNEELCIEPTVRKKAEKMALPGWCCEECKKFFGTLYADDVDKIKEVIEKCSKHRGRNNPIRPKTPPMFWNPRWDVPESTEEFNRRNNAC